MSGVRGTRVNAFGEQEYTLKFPTHVVSYRPKREYADLNCHARTNRTGMMTTTGDPCEYLGGGETCWFDGTGLAPVLTNEDEIFALMERWWPEEGA